RIDGVGLRVTQVAHLDAATSPAVSFNARMTVVAARVVDDVQRGRYLRASRNEMVDLVVDVTSAVDATGGEDADGVRVGGAIARVYGRCERVAVLAARSDRFEGAVRFSRRLRLGNFGDRA